MIFSSEKLGALQRELSELKDSLRKFVPCNKCGCLMHQDRALARIHTNGWQYQETLFFCKTDAPLWNRRHDGIDGETYYFVDSVPCDEAGVPLKRTK